MAWRSVWSSGCCGAKAAFSAIVSELVSDITALHLTRCGKEWSTAYASVKDARTRRNNPLRVTNRALVVRCRHQNGQECPGKADVSGNLICDHLVRVALATTAS